MGDILIFILHCVLFIGEYSFVLAMSFDILYLITVKSFFKELENQ